MFSVSHTLKAVKTALFLRNLTIMHAWPCFALIHNQGDMPTDDATLKIVTNLEVLAIQESSTKGREVSNVARCEAPVAAYKCNEVVWAAEDGVGGQYVAIFWTGSGNRTVRVSLAGIRSSGAKVRDLWKLQDTQAVAAGGSLTAHLLSGDVALLRLSSNNQVTV